MSRARATWTRPRAPAATRAVSMAEAVGYGAIECTQQRSLQDAVVLKHDRCFLVANEMGNIAPAGDCGLGLFHDDTRILSHYAMRVDAGELVLLSSQVTSPYHAFIDLAVTDLALGGDLWDPKNVIHIRRELLLQDRLVERLSLTNYLGRPVELGIELDLGCDFADIFEVRGWKRPARGQFFAPVSSADALSFSYRGRDDVSIGSRIDFVQPPEVIGSHGARWRIRLVPGACEVLQWEIQPVDDSVPTRLVVEEERRRLDEEYTRWRTRCARWRTNVVEFNTALDRAVDDLRALYTRDSGERFLSAGIPWYSTAFGRDSIIASLQTLPLNPRIAVDTLIYLARHQGEREDPYTEEQPGKIMHELRRGELARAREIPHLPYYGTVDATPLWLVLLHETWRWTGDEALVRRLLPHAERALEWIDRYGDADGDGMVEYARTSAKGLVNQGWKDSGDGVRFPDGRQPDPPIALVEVQGYVYDAKLRMSRLFAALGQSDRAARLEREAEALRRNIQERFWLEDLGTFALALDGSKEPLRTVTSNAGHLLWSRVPEPDQAARMAELFASPSMFSGWGIRTVAADQAIYNPMSYHNGSVWPHDNAIVVLGLSLYGLAHSCLPVLCALHDSANHMPHARLPELFCGMQRRGGIRPVLYPVGCSPQAWASGAFFMMLQAVLGLHPEAPEGVLHVREPRLPDFLKELTVDGLRVGGSRVSLRFRRRRDRTLVNLLALEGAPLQVRIELS